MRAARSKFRASNEHNEAILRPLIDRVTDAAEAALLDLEHGHQLVADRTDLDLLGDTRPTARWLVTGRAVGLAHAGLTLVRFGYTSEAVPVVRSMHETVRLLSVVSLPGKDDLVKRWIAGRDVRRKQIMLAGERQEQELRARMLREGTRPANVTTPYFVRQYGHWSEFAHPRRHHMAAQVNDDARIMATGPHLDWRARAAFTEHFGYALAELLSVGGHALGRFLGREWYDESQATYRSFLDLLEQSALDTRAQGQQPKTRPL